MKDPTRSQAALSEQALHRRKIVNFQTQAFESTAWSTTTSNQLAAVAKIQKFTSKTGQPQLTYEAVVSEPEK